MEISELHLLIGYLREDFKDFKKNDFTHLSEKVEKIEEKINKLALKIAVIVGAISAVTVIINILVRVYG